MGKNLKLAIVGSRDYHSYLLLKREVLKWFNINDIDIIVSGGADGVDSLAEEFAVEFKKEVKVFPANWNDLTHSDARIKTNKWGKQYDANAGHRRNQQIVDYCDAMIAFWLNKSSGTGDSIKKMQKSGKPLVIIDL